MNVSLTMIRRLTAAAAALALVGAGSAAGGPPPGMTPQEYRALVIRGQAMNRLYVNKETRSADAIRGQALNRLYGNGWTAMGVGEFKRLVSLFGPQVTALDAQEVRALYARGLELNRLHGNGWTRLSPERFRSEYVRGIEMNRRYVDVPRQLSAPQTTPAPAIRGEGFDWADAGIGFAAAMGILLLGSAGAIVLRSRGRLAFLHR